MAFDAGMVAAVAAELRGRLIGGRVDKISQPEKDEITLAVRVADGSYARVCISAGNNNPHIIFIRGIYHRGHFFKGLRTIIRSVKQMIMYICKKHISFPFCMSSLSLCHKE